MKQNRQQDKGSLLKLRINDINFRLRLGVDAATLAEEARAVNKEVAAARMDGETCGFAEGSLGVLLYISGAPKTGTAKERFHDEALAEFREAIKHAPKHGDSITWRWLLVEILDAKANQTTAETQEASQRIAEARLMPGSGNHQGRARILALDKKYNSK